MKKYIDWIVEGVVLSAMVIAFLFVVGKNRSSSIVFEGEVGTMIFFIAVFSCIMAIFLLHMKKRDNRFVIVVSGIYALENLIIYYASLGGIIDTNISHDALFLTFLVGSIAWSITKYEVESIMKQK